MEPFVVEVGMKLKYNLIYYHNLLIENGLELLFSSITRDVYYTNKNLDSMSENEMKKACTRIRYCQGLNKEKKNISVLEESERTLISKGYKKVFDTIKFDFQYGCNSMKSRIQLQDIKDIGLIVYYDNPDYYNLELSEQRMCLLRELNKYGFSFNENDLGIDKLRTLYYKKEKYSLNQNG